MAVVVTQSTEDWVIASQSASTRPPVIFRPIMYNCVLTHIVPQVLTKGVTAVFTG